METLNNTKQNATEYAMANDDLKKLVLRYSIPTIIGMLVNALYNVVDRFWIGRLPGEAGLHGLSGVGLCMSVLTVFLAVGQLVGMGSAAVISIHLGRKDRDGAQNVLGNALTLISILSVFVTALIFIFRSDILMFIGADENTFGYAYDYTTVSLAGSVPYMVFLALNHCIRATGNPKRFASTQILGAVINMILDPILIFTFGLGIKGAAYATAFSWVVSCVWVLSYYFGKSAAIRFHLKHLKIKLSVMTRIFSIGFAPFLMHIMGSLIIVIANRTLKYYGDIELSSGSVAIGAFTVINSISMLFMMPMIGINQGSQPIIGYNFGAKNYARSKEALKWAITYSVMICAAGFVLLQLFAPYFIIAFNPDEELVRVGAVGLRVFLFAIPVVGFQIPASNFFQSIGRAKMSILLTLLRQVILLVPLYFLLPPFFGLMGIWVACPIADITAALITLLVLRREFRLLGKLGKD